MPGVQGAAGSWASQDSPATDSLGPPIPLDGLGRTSSGLRVKRPDHEPPDHDSGPSGPHIRYVEPLQRLHSTPTPTRSSLAPALRHQASEGIPGVAGYKHARHGSVVSFAAAEPYQPARLSASQQPPQHGPADMHLASTSEAILEEQAGAAAQAPPGEATASSAAGEAAASSASGLGGLPPVAEEAEQQASGGSMAQGLQDGQGSARPGIGRGSLSRLEGSSEVKPLSRPFVGSGSI